MRTPRPCGNTALRGYGGAHQKERASWEPVVESGNGYCHAVICKLRSRWIPPGSTWNLGHTPDRTAWTGPEHEHCNKSEGATRGNRQRNSVLVTTRQWLRRTCEICGEPYRSSYSNQRTCGRVCGVELKQLKQLAHWLGTDGPTCRIYVRDCGWCAHPFVARHPRVRYCSRSHARQAGWARSNQARRVTDRACPCGKPIEATRNKCDQCVRIAKRERKRREKRAARLRAK